MTRSGFDCPICLDYYSEEPEGDYFVATNCSKRRTPNDPLYDSIDPDSAGHVFHIKCLNKSVRRPDAGVFNCPMCRHRNHFVALRKLNNIDVKPKPNIDVFDHEFKIVVLGKYKAGKTSIVKRFARNVFSEEYTITEDVDYFAKSVQLGDRRIKLNLWDTAGQEQYRSVVTSYVRNAFGMIFVYDISDMSTFRALEDWILFANDNGPPETKRILVGNKSDLEEQREVSTAEGENFARTVGYPFLECSAKEATNVSSIFRTLTAEMLDEPRIRQAADKLYDAKRLEEEFKNLKFSDKCVADGGSCSEFDPERQCCSAKCEQVVRGATSGMCRPAANGNAPGPLSGCLENTAPCKSDASLGNCCSTFCLQLERAPTGICINRPNATSSSAPTHGHAGNAGLAIGLTFAVLAIVGLLLAVIVLLLKMKKDLLTKAEIYRFLRGSPDQAALDLPTHQKVDVLPYDASYEILPEKFTIENQILGSGEFGIVRKGSVKQFPNSDPVEVAVKTTAEGAEVRYVKALLSELKLMIYIGIHGNVVTLLGACTRDLKKGEETVLVMNGQAYLFLEFCALGSLEGYLRKQKHTFTSIGDSTRPYANSPMYLPSEDVSHALTTRDLHHWSLQIAHGLEFLSSKKVVHGDLATRNVLLATRSIAKISDFGLSRRVYDYTNYVKKQQEPLPWKWMAIESLQELSFSIKSDVWGFAVTLWEIFSLGSTPYPGLSWSTTFVQDVVNGLRLPMPLYGTQQIYNLLLECWNLNPESRPRSDTIVQTLQKLQPNFN